MGYVMMSARKVYLTGKINEYNFQLEMLSKQKHELLTYAENISDGRLSLGEMAGMPLALRGMALQYACCGQDPAFQMARQEGNMFAQNYMASLANSCGCDPDAITRYFVEQAFKARIAECKKAEEARLHVIENDIDMKMKKIETRLKAAQQELQSVEKAEDQAIQRSVPKYA